MSRAPEETSMPAWDVAAVTAAARRLRLATDPRRRRIGAGVRLGAGPGASLEFHDHRAYTPGDDLRHLDWGVYARSDQLVLRRHRQEVSPRVEVLLDASASMGITAAKFVLALELTALLATLAELDGARPLVWILAGNAQRLGAGSPGDWRAALGGLVAKGAAGLEARPAPSLLPGAERFLISDGLCPGGGAAVVRALGQGAGRLCLIQVLTAEESSPAPLGAVRLSDAEGGERDLVLDDNARHEYGLRFARHQSDWQAALAGRGTGLITCAADERLPGALVRLLKSGAVEPRSG